MAHAMNLNIASYKNSSVSKCQTMENWKVWGRSSSDIGMTGCFVFERHHFESSQAALFAKLLSETD